MRGRRGSSGCASGSPTAASRSTRSRCWARTTATTSSRARAVARGAARAHAGVRGVGVHAPAARRTVRDRGHPPDRARRLRRSGRRSLRAPRRLLGDRRGSRVAHPRAAGAGLQGAARPGPRLRDATASTFVDCLQTVKAWSDAHPRHLPIMILIEAKDDVTPRSLQLRLRHADPARRRRARLRSTPRSARCFRARS